MRGERSHGLIVPRRPLHEAGLIALFVSGELLSSRPQVLLYWNKWGVLIINTILFSFGLYSVSSTHNDLFSYFVHESFSTKWSYSYGFHSKIDTFPNILIFITTLNQSWSYFCIQFILYCWLGSLKTWGERETF